ncbi:DUF1428 domain-containing protein [Brevundimonas diminuta]|uniref:DUF1428 domain-containing protein n=1 Tax=Brevundimonas diminuta TaxID=293 RepID=UPI003209E7BD
MSYVTGFLTPVKAENKARYIESARVSWPLFKSYGARAHVENWGVDVPDGKVTSFPMAVKLEEGEVVVFSWLIWPDKKTADDAWARMQDDPAMANMDMPFDGQRMMWGGFETIFDEKK